MLLNVFALLKCRRAVAFGISLKQCINSEFLNAVSKLLMCTTTVISSTHFRMILSLWKVKSSPHLWESRVTWFCCYLWPLLLLSAELNWTVELKHWAEVKRNQSSKWWSRHWSAVHRHGLAQTDVVPLQADCSQAVLHLCLLFLSTQIHSCATICQVLML